MVKKRVFGRKKGCLDQKKIGQKHFFSQTSFFIHFLAKFKQKIAQKSKNKAVN